MIGVVVVTHGRLASEMLRAAEIIVGTIEGARAVDIEPSMGVEEIHGAIEDALREVDTGDGALLLTDMFGGTPSNIGLSFLGTHAVEVLTGVNLPMMIKFPMARREMKLSDLARHLLEFGQRNITNPGELLRKRAEKK